MTSLEERMRQLKDEHAFLNDIVYYVDADMAYLLDILNCPTDTTHSLARQDVTDSIIED